MCEHRSITCQCDSGESVPINTAYSHTLYLCVPAHIQTHTKSLTCPLCHPFLYVVHRLLHLQSLLTTSTWPTGQETTRTSVQHFQLHVKGKNCKLVFPLDESTLRSSKSLKQALNCKLEEALGLPTCFLCDSLTSSSCSAAQPSHPAPLHC